MFAVRWSRRHSRKKISSRQAKTPNYPAGLAWWPFINGLSCGRAPRTVLLTHLEKDVRHGNQTQETPRSGHGHHRRHQRHRPDHRPHGRRTRRPSRAGRAQQGRPRRTGGRAAQPRRHGRDRGRRRRQHRGRREDRREGHRALRPHRHLGQQCRHLGVRPAGRSQAGRPPSPVPDQLLGHRQRFAGSGTAHEAPRRRRHHQRRQRSVGTRHPDAGHVRGLEACGEGLHRCAAHGSGKGRRAAGGHAGAPGRDRHHVRGPRAQLHGQGTGPAAADLRAGSGGRRHPVLRRESEARRLRRRRLEDDRGRLQADAGAVRPLHERQHVQAAKIGPSHCAEPPRRPLQAG